ncbi:AsmA protein [Halopseudomonas xinjiangensis]|uniref:AsmA protein n=1 Tax=Halopseudomonas xinjiangensis TaxID=487184 RepID=A0A1H1YLU6_9GAMM|nr:AsmA family protein [Halopseudomonas xinjiangensis]SDT22423.1 AsmA protein [Halopseudomonas xinjiangensis]
MKAAKIVGLVLLSLLVLIVIALFIVTRLFDPNDYKEQIQQAARDKANVELTLGGDIGWSLFPWLGIELGDVTVAPLEQPDQPLAQVGSMGLGVEVLPLLRRQLRMSDVILDSVTLNLVRDAEGNGNWETVGPQEPVDEPLPSGDQPQTEQEQQEFDLAIESVRVTNAAVSYVDRQSGRTIQLEDLNLRTGALIEGRPVDVEVLGLVVLDQPLMRIRIDLNAIALFNLEQQQYQLDAIDLNVDASGAPFDGRAVSLRLQGDARLDRAAQTAELNQVRLSLADLRATGQLTATDIDGDLRLAGALNVADFNARELLASLGQDIPATADPRALEKASLSARLEGSAQSFMLEDLQLTIDDATLTGRAGLADFERQALRFDLAGERLDLDRFLPPEEQVESAQEVVAPPVAGRGEGGTRSASAPLEWSDAPILPLETLARLDVDGKLAVQQLILTGQTFESFVASVQAANGRVRLRQLEGGVFGGKFSATGEIDTRATPVRVQATKQLRSMDSQAIQEAYEVPLQFRGELDMDLDVTARGNSMARWMNTLTGSARFDVQDGALLGVNLEQQACQAIALANRKSLGQPRGAENTPFNRLRGTFKIVDGTVTTNDLVVAVPGIQASGRGALELPVQRMDFRLGLLIEGDKSEMPDPACQVNERYRDIQWPVRCQGFLHNAAKSCGVDTDEVAKIAGRLLGDEARRKVEERVEEKLGDQAPAVRDAIRGLLGR